MSWATGVEKLRKEVEDRLVARLSDDQRWRVLLACIEHQRFSGGTQPEVRGHHRSVACLDIGRFDRDETGQRDTVDAEAYRRAASWLCDLDADRVNGWFRQATVHRKIRTVVLEGIGEDFGTLAESAAGGWNCTIMMDGQPDIEMTLDLSVEEDGSTVGGSFSIPATSAGGSVTGTFDAASGKLMLTITLADGSSGTCELVIEGDSVSGTGTGPDGAMSKVAGSRGEPPLHAAGSRESGPASERPWLHVVEVAVEQTAEANWRLGEWECHGPLWRVKVTCLARREPEGSKAVPTRTNARTYAAAGGNDSRDSEYR